MYPGISFKTATKNRRKSGLLIMTGHRPGFELMYPSPNPPTPQGGWSTLPAEHPAAFDSSVSPHAVTVAFSYAIGPVYACEGGLPLFVFRGSWFVVPSPPVLFLIRIPKSTLEHNA